MDSGLTHFLLPVFCVSYDVAAMKQPMERFISVKYSILTNLFSISYIHTYNGWGLLLLFFSYFFFLFVRKDLIM